MAMSIVVVVVFVFVAATAATSVVVVVVILLLLLLLLPHLQLVGWATIYNWWSVLWSDFGKFIPLEFPDKG
jgi:hypothetical protein